jgi:hypothetical protein
MTRAHWKYGELRGFPHDKATLGGSDLSVAYVGGEWQWLMRHAGHNIDAGSARPCRGAKQQAEDAARLLLVVPRLRRPARCETVDSRLSLRAKRSNLGATVPYPGGDCFVACGSSQ